MFRTVIFDEIRLLTNFQLDDQNLLSIILMGQPELRKILAKPLYEPFRQRIAINYQLSLSDLEETQEYIDFRIAVAGGPRNFFSRCRSVDFRAFRRCAS